MDEAQFEKVEKGLECCEPYLWQHCHRKQCPYYNDNGCLEAQMADALVLIRQQQKKIRELEAELGKWDDNAAVEMQQYRERYGTYL